MIQIGRLQLELLGRKTINQRMYTISLVVLILIPKSEFIGQVVGPIDVTWIGWSLCDSMIGCLLLLFWPDGDKVVASPRITA